MLYRLTTAQHGGRVMTNSYTAEEIEGIDLLALARSVHRLTIEVME